MSLRAALTTRKRSLPLLTEPTAVLRLLAELSSMPTGESAKPAVDLNTVAERFMHQLARGREPTVGDWNKIMCCIWSTEPAIAEHDEALDSVLARVAEMRRKRPYRQLASVYLSEFGPDRPRLDRISYVLSSFAPVAGEPWTGLSARYDVFNGPGPIVQMARVALGRQMSVQTFLQAVGLSTVCRERLRGIHARCRADRIARYSYHGGIGAA